MSEIDITRDHAWLGRAIDVIKNIYSAKTPKTPFTLGRFSGALALENSLY